MRPCRQVFLACATRHESADATKNISLDKEREIYIYVFCRAPRYCYLHGVALAWNLSTTWWSTSAVTAKFRLHSESGGSLLPAMTSHIVVSPWISWSQEGIRYLAELLLSFSQKKNMYIYIYTNMTFGIPSCRPDLSGPS